MLVVDTSAALDALVGAGDRSGELRERLVGDGDLHAPHLLDVEAASALRRMARRGELTDARASDALGDLRDLHLHRYPHEPLLERIWELRDNLTAYDATFVCLAEILDAPLLTRDRRLASSPGHQATIELIG
ncbi:MAG: type II toxin-antitoxin system VapC family toxin [Solirubrobacterales bacterium]